MSMFKGRDLASVIDCRLEGVQFLKLILNNLNIIIQASNDIEIDRSGSNRTWVFYIMPCELGSDGQIQGII